jgi:pyruvate dehydrogenase E2 component (dihydrolipoamide acetyltransferase)
MATEVIIPVLGVTTEKVKILTWFKSEGDFVKQGERLLEIESDKLTSEISSPRTGVLGCILYPEGSEVEIAKVVAVIVAEGEAVPEAYLQALGEETLSGAPMVQVPAPGGEKVPMEVKVVPAARKLAEEKGVDVSQVTPTGPHGTIMRMDVEAYLASGVMERKSQKVSGLARKVAEELKVPLEGVEGKGAGGRVMRADILRAVEQRGSVAKELIKGEGLFGKTIPMNTMRKVIARRLSESAFTAPHIYLFTDVDMGKVMELQESIREDFEKRFRVRVSVNDFLIKSVGLAIREYPLFNAMVKGDKIHIHPEINVGIAVALEDGLIVPAISQADRLGLGGIATERAELVERARHGKLALVEIERGTFTVSSLAGYEITFFTAIINPPQSGILSVGKIEEQLYMENGEVKVRRVSRFGLSADHRIIDGAVAAKFLGTIKKIMENPTFYFLDL